MESCGKMAGFIERIMQFVPMDLNIRDVEFGLRDLCAGEDEAEVSIGRNVPSGSLGAVVKFYVLSRPPCYDEVAEASTE